MQQATLQGADLTVRTHMRFSVFLTKTSGQQALSAEIQLVIAIPTDCRLNRI